MNKLLYKKPEGMTNAQLEKIRRICQDEVQKREELKRERFLKEFIGKYYKYKNSYSCPQEEKDYWWLYIHIIEVKDGWLRVFEFQKDQYGKIIIEDNATMSSPTPDDKYIECTVEEFYREWQNMMDNINLPSGLV